MICLLKLIDCICVDGTIARRSAKEEDDWKDDDLEDEGGDVTDEELLTSEELDTEDGSVPDLDDTDVDPDRGYSVLVKADTGEFCRLYCSCGLA